jgi:hypothetical protein
VSFTYTPGTSIARVRVRLADTVAERALYSDEEINDALATEGSVEGAVAMFSRATVVRAARSARSYSNDQGSVDDTAGLQYLQAEAEKALADAATTAPTATLPLAVVGTLGRAPNDPYYVVGSG